VARIELGAQNYTLMGRMNGKPSAILAVYQLPGSTAVNDSKAVQALMALMAQLKKSFPPDIDYVIALDQTKAVTEGLREIVLTLAIALVLVIIVVYLFLQGWRATLIPLLAVPVSLVGIFAAFPLFGFSINTPSMFGMVLAIGLVVDDAIVVVEVVERHIEEGMAPKDAALKAVDKFLAAARKRPEIAPPSPASRMRREGQRPCVTAHASGNRILSTDLVSAICEVNPRCHARLPAGHGGLAMSTGRERPLSPQGL
jgi:multidrug efflux pump subunit AcrB